MKVTGSDTTIESDDPAVVEPMLAELLSKLNIRQGKQFSVDGEVASTNAHAFIYIVSAANCLTICLMGGQIPPFASKSNAIWHRTGLDYGTS